MCSPSPGGVLKQTLLLDINSAVFLSSALQRVVPVVPLGCRAAPPRRLTSAQSPFELCRNSTVPVPKGGEGWAPRPVGPLNRSSSSLWSPQCAVEDGRKENHLQIQTFQHVLLYIRRPAGWVSKHSVIEPVPCRCESGYESKVPKCNRSLEVSEYKYI